MTDLRSASIGENSEEARALLQARVALFWKVMLVVSLLSVAMGALGAIARPGVDFLILLGLTAQAAVCWALCRSGRRSLRFLQLMESGALLLNLSGGSLMGRYLAAGFARDHAITTVEGAVMADGFIAMQLIGGVALMVAVRAALIPSSPRRTAVVSALVGVPMLLAVTFLAPATADGLAWRSADSSAYPWLPAIAIIMWGFVVLTCTVTTWVIYSLRAQVREARRFGQYVLERKLGEGGMGEVYQARHGMMRRPSAVKLLRVDRIGELNLRRFEREVQLTARLTHPNTITLFDYGRTEDGVFYYAMELLDGANLQRIVAAGGPQAPGRVVRILSMACGALAEAHAIGLIHRDLKPANIMLCARGGEHDVAKVLDFGLVKELRADGDPRLTGANTVTGSPQSMAPESIRDPESVDARTDIYALGTVAYFLLAGVDVFDGKSVVEICGQHLHEAPKPFAARGVTVPAALEAIVLACLEKDPALRPQSAAALKQRLDACLVEPWDAARAEAWWREHRAALEALAAELPGELRTIAVDRAGRATAP